MKVSFLSAVAAALILAGVGVSAQPSNVASVPPWTKEQGVAIRAYSETQRDVPFFDPNLKLEEGVELPQNATLHLIPNTLKVGSPDLHAYSIVKDRAVLVDRATRKVIHIWE